MDKYIYICDAKRRLADGKCDGGACKFLKNGECERTFDISYAKNKFDRNNFKFIAYQGNGDIDFYGEKNKKGEYI